MSRLSPEERRAAEERILAAIARAAERGEPCPSNPELAALIGLTGRASAVLYIHSLESRGLIHVERFGSGRVVTVVATGKSTTHEGSRRPHWRAGEVAPTGAELAGAIRSRATELGRSINSFVAPLAKDPNKYLAQLAAAASPRPATVARVRALLAGEPVPVAPPNNFQAGPRRPATHSVRQGLADPEAEPEPIDREPCFFCGTRADFLAEAPDLGCRHCRRSQAA